MTNFTSIQVNDLRKELFLTMKNFCEEKNLDFDLSGVRYSENKAKVSLELFTKSEDGSSVGEYNDFILNCKKFGISKELYGKKININNKVYEICGINSRARKYPIELRDVNTGERSLKCSVQHAINGAY